MARAPRKTASKPKAANDEKGGKPTGKYAGHDILLVNGAISDRLFAQIVKATTNDKVAERVVVVLVTYGGQANAAYRIARFLQVMYEDVTVFVPSFCKSAGTLIVTGANELLMTPYGEIGPLDVQLIQRDELGERKSGLTIRSALEDLKSHSYELFEHFMHSIKDSSGGAVSFKLASEIATQVTTGLLDRVYEQVHPDVLGKDYRDLSVATEYGQRLNSKYRNLKDGAINRLVHEYPSHDFVIDFREAQELFERVSVPNLQEFPIIRERQRDFMVAKQGQGIVELIPPKVLEASEVSDDDGKTGHEGAPGEAEPKPTEPDAA